MALRRDTSIQFLKGVGPKLGDLFMRKGLKTVQDLIEFYPRSYEDRRAVRQIATLRGGDMVSLKAQIHSVHAVRLGKSSRKMYDVVIQDPSGRIHCKFFRVPYKGYFERFAPHQEIRVVGKVTDYRGRLEFHHPDLRDIEPDEDLSDALIPIYTEIEGLSTAKIQKLIQSALRQLPKDEWGPETFPKWMIEKYGLMGRSLALQKLHDPPVDQAKDYLDQKSEAHRRIIFEEFFWLELYLAAKRTGFKKDQALPVRAEGLGVKRLLASLPFGLTGAQERAFREIVEDMSKDSPMHRLVQGDVGSGKTLVSFMAAMNTAEAGFQSCLMAPTEILAEQHSKNAEKFLAPLGLRIGLLTGTTKAAERREVLARLEQGEIDLLIGTHALIEADVIFHRLGLVVIDEQHRFGVAQRGQLKRKGENPHFLVMTATPIPRTLAMTVYGDLDVSVIDELPPGRTPIQTRVIYESKKSQALDFMIQQLQKGRQAYVVYPLVEESEKIDLKDAVSQFEKLKNQFPLIRFDLLHGKMKSSEKDEVMDRFRRGLTQVLVSTTVIEVGVDVPNANLMLIEHAERFGLSQLHQLRGRVGRGEHKSFCVMILGYAVSEEARLRTEFMEKNTDGFKIAEFDLEMRGPGEFLGTRQSGLPGFKIANLVRDVGILQQAREAAFETLERDPQLKKKDHGLLREELFRAHGPTELAGIA